VALSPEEREAIAASQSAGERGEFATDEQVRAVWDKHGRLGRAEEIADLDPDILGGVPVFRGTHIPIHMIADLLNHGEAAETLRKGYPRLTDEMIRLAPIYAAAHPLQTK
jgi:uncharacterized protein (DUF433 family)